jgi:hypothetical protein
MNPPREGKYTKKRWRKGKRIRKKANEAIEKVDSGDKITKNTERERERKRDTFGIYLDMKKNQGIVLLGCTWTCLLS